MAIDYSTALGALAEQFSAAKLQRIKDAMAEKTAPKFVYAEPASMSIPGFPAPGTALYSDGCFPSRVRSYDTGLYADIVWARPDRSGSLRLVSGSQCDWVAFMRSSDGSTVSVGGAGFLYSTGKAVVDLSAITYFPVGQFDGMLALAIMSSQQITLETALKGYSQNAATSDAIIKAIQSNAYSLPVATPTSLGGIKVGSTLSIADGVLNSNTAKTAFSNAYASLDSILIGGVGYKVTICGNASDAQSTASGAYSTASGGYSVASSAYSTASGGDSVASGYGSVASGGDSTASGYGSVASGARSTASGAYSKAYINYEFTFDGFVDVSTPVNRTMDLYSIEKVFFRNSDVNSAYTAFSQYTSGHYLNEYLGAGTPTTVTETIANIIAGTSQYFDISGSGTSGAPYVVKPKASYSVPHAHRLYQITITAAPVSDTYINFQGSNTERCMMKLTSSLYGLATKYMVSYLNIAGYVRSRNKLNSGTLTSLPMDSSSANAVIVTDLNSADIYTSYSL